MAKQASNYRNIADIKPNPKNPRVIKDEKYRQLMHSLATFPQMLDKRPLVCFTDKDGKFTVLGGNMRLKAAIELGMKELPVILADDWTEEQKAEFLIKDNVGFGEWNWDELQDDWDVQQLEEWGLDLPGFEADVESTEDAEIIAHQKLTEKFIVPPFSILDTRQGYWQERKRHWRVLSADKGETRIGALYKGGGKEGGVTNKLFAFNANNGVSLLDPVLAELVNTWFGVPGGNTFDCFAGDSVFGYVSAYLGNTFTGIELRKEQADLNNSRIAGFKAKYICDDGRNVLNHIKPDSQDLLFSCPPYFDLEVYSDLPEDASNQKEYSDFLKILDEAFTAAIKCLKENRFAVITVGDVRDKKGFYYRFVDDIKDIFKKSGVLLYNECILVEPVGTSAMKAGAAMITRKIVKTHQNVLVFFKGNPKEIKSIYPKLEIIIDGSADV